MGKTFYPPLKAQPYSDDIGVEPMAFGEIMQETEQALLLFNEWLASNHGCHFCKKVPSVVISEISRSISGKVWRVSEMTIMDRDWGKLSFYSGMSASGEVHIHICAECLKEKGLTGAS